MSKKPAAKSANKQPKAWPPAPPPTSSGKPKKKTVNQLSMVSKRPKNGEGW